jgi:hypothetical protein
VPNQIKVELILDDLKAKGQLDKFTAYMAKIGKLDILINTSGNKRQIAEYAKQFSDSLATAVQTGLVRGFARARTEILALSKASDSTTSPFPVGFPTSRGVGPAGRFRRIIQGQVIDVGGGGGAPPVIPNSGFPIPSGGGGGSGGLGLVIAASIGVVVAKLIVELGKLILKLAQFGAAIIAMLARWNEAGAQLFNRAAKVGLSSSATYYAGEIAKISGLDPSQVENLMLRSEFGSRRGGFRYQQQGQNQQLNNILKSTRDYIASISGFLESDARIMQNVAGINKRITLDIGNVLREWDVFKSVVASEFQKPFELMTRIIADFIHTATNLIATLASVIRAYGLGFFTGLGVPNFASALFSNPAGLSQNNSKQFAFQRGTATALEKMGLVIGGGHDKVYNKLSQIEQNTRIVAQHIGNGLLSGSSFGSDPLNLYAATHNTP